MAKVKYSTYYQNCLQGLSLLFPTENVLNLLDLMYTPSEIDNNTEIEMVYFSSDNVEKINIDVPS